MIIASMAKVSKLYPSLTVLEDINLAIKQGEKIGLVGANGTGKTTLLEILAGLIEIEQGSVDIVKGTRIGYLPQTFAESIAARNSGAMTLFEFIQGGFDDLIELKKQIKSLECKIADHTATEPEQNRYSEALARFEFRGGYGMEARIEKVAAGLGFTKEMFESSVATLSGGEKNRALLGRLLVSEPDLMLMDEPTNHLDIEGIEFLESYIKESPASTVIVSHDRRFLDRTVEKIWELYNTRIKTYPGNYSQYVETRSKQAELELKAYTEQQEFIRKTKNFIAKNIAGQKTKQAQSRRKMLERIRMVDKPSSAQKAMGIRLDGVERSDRIVGCFKNVYFNYDSRELLHDVSFTIERGDKVGLIGSNGTGKSTILELLIDKLTPDDGEILRGKKITPGYFKQTRDEFNPDDTVMEIMGRVLPKETEGKHRDYLARFLFTGDDVFRKVGTFSGGQQSRLALAILLANTPNFLILDEPTNHLDIMSREALELALYEYDGTLLVVSHDRYFLDNVTDMIFSLKNSRLTTYLGNYSYFVEKKAALESANQVPVKIKKPKEKKNQSKRINPQIVRKQEEQITATEEKLQAIYDEIESGKYASQWEELQKLNQQKESLENELIMMYEKLDELTSER